MYKLADISSFEGLQNQSVHNAVSDIAVFNMSAEQALKYLIQGAYYGDVGQGLQAIIEEYGEELIAQGITDYEEAGRRAGDLGEEVKELIRKEPGFWEYTYTDGYEDTDKNDPDAEPEEGSWAAYGGADGVCDAIGYCVSDYVRFNS